MYSFLNNPKTTSAISDYKIFSRDIKNAQQFEPIPYSQDSLETRLKKSTQYTVLSPSEDPESSVADGEIIENNLGCVCEKCKIK